MRWIDHRSIGTTILMFCILWPSLVSALPQFAVRSTRACDTCHVEPTGWTDPEVALRKCSLNCNTCHISPSGGGMRNASGLFYGRQTLPLWNKLLGEKTGNHPEVPSSQPMKQPWVNPAVSARYENRAANHGPPSASSQATSMPMAPRPTSQPSSMPVRPVATAQPSSMPASSQPTTLNGHLQGRITGAGSQPTIMPALSPHTATQPLSYPAQLSALEWPETVPAPGTAGRYAGIDPNPTVQVGGDLRLAVYHPLGDDPGEDTAVFPMQTDLYLAYRPYNPKALNEGRITLLTSVGSLGSRGEAFEGFTDRFFVREWYVMYHDLPHQMYVRAGRFLPAHGWRTDDHTGFTRQEQMVLGQPLDHESQVTGVEFGLNPNYPYLHVSAFNIADEWDSPIDGEKGYGAAISGGWRDLGWHGGGSVIYGQREAVENTPKWADLAASLQWALNLHYLVPGLPFVYLGEYHMLRKSVGDQDPAVGLSAFHEVGYLVMEGLNLTTRYDWQDSDIEFRYDTRHRVNIGFEWYPVPFLEVIARYRHNWKHTDDRFESGDDEILFMLHGWY